jgi:hypothetical protein
MASIWVKSMVRQGIFVRGAAQAVLPVFFLLAAGCGSQSSGTVTGKVTYRGEVVPAGIVFFFGSGEQAASAQIAGDGSYEASGVPLGDVKVAVSGPPPRPSKEQAANNPMLRKRGYVPPDEKSVSIPGKYSRPGTSGLGVTVTEGAQTFDIDLK